jgi:hypothetical protein
LYVAGSAIHGQYRVQTEEDMTINMGGTDRAVRAFVAVIIAILYYTGVIGGTLALVLGIVAVLFAVTSLFGFCPLYAALGMSTKRTAPGLPM